MAKEHKYHHSRVEIDTALSAQLVLQYARQTVDTQKSLRLDDEYESAFSVLVKNWAGVTMVHFTVEASAHGNRTHVVTCLREYRTSQTTYFFVPVAPKTVEGYAEYRSFMRAFAAVIEAADPSAIHAIIELGAGGGILDVGLTRKELAEPSTPHAEPVESSEVNANTSAPDQVGKYEPNLAAEMVLDPATGAADLADIAAAYPRLRWFVSRHPNAYVALIEWIEAQGAADVGAAPAGREQQAVSAMRKVLNPSTPANELAEIAAVHPELWSFVRQHPNGYPELTAWMDQIEQARPSVPQTTT